MKSLVLDEDAVCAIRGGDFHVPAGRDASSSLQWAWRSGPCHPPERWCTALAPHRADAEGLGGLPEPRQRVCARWQLLLGLRVFQPVLLPGDLHLLGVAWVGFEHEQVAGCAAAACDHCVPGS